MTTNIRTIGDLYTAYSICPTDMFAPENNRLANGIENASIELRMTQREDWRRG